MTTKTKELKAHGGLTLTLHCQCGQHLVLDVGLVVRRGDYANADEAFSDLLTCPPGGWKSRSEGVILCPACAKLFGEAPHLCRACGDLCRDTDIELAKHGTANPDYWEEVCPNCGATDTLEEI